MGPEIIRPHERSPTRSVRRYSQTPLNRPLPWLVLVVILRRQRMERRRDVTQTTNDALIDPAMRGRRPRSMDLVECAVVAVGEDLGVFVDGHVSPLSPMTLRGRLDKVPR